ncbi:MAG: TetR/AcrR family transcriptional regulator [Kineosporiaceae bacterium]
MPSSTSPRAGPGRPEGLRERRRRELLDDVLATARRHVAEHGAAAMSVRAVARDIGIAPSALYRYYPSRDELLTTLIAETYVEIHDVLDAAVTTALAAHQGDLLAAWVETTAAYRDWARAHSADFALVYGSPIPGYAAPEEGTRDVGRRSGEPLMRLLGAALQSGVVDLDAARAAASGMGPAMREALAARGHAQGLDVPEDLAAGLVEFALTAWAQLHGLVSVDVFGHLPPMAGFADEFFDRASAAIFVRGLRH